MIKTILALLAVTMPTPTYAPTVFAPYTDPSIPPSLNLSAVRYIACQKGDDFYTGSAFLIGPGILATARHVAHGDKCVDVQTETVVTEYQDDPRHDFALMSAPGLPRNIPYVRYRCDGIKPNTTYLSYGVTDYGQSVPILRMNTVVSTGDIVKSDDAVDDLPYSKGMRVFKGPVAPGMSGGPVVDTQGYAVAVNNAGNAMTTLLFGLKDTIICKK
jgi:S1-C subfamily serine protease